MCYHYTLISPLPLEDYEFPKPKEELKKVFSETCTCNKAEMLTVGLCGCSTDCDCDINKQLLAFDKKARPEFYYIK